MVMAHPTTSGATGRRERLGNVARFLRFAVEHCGTAEQYRPPLDYRDLIGKRQQRKPPATPPQGTIQTQPPAEEPTGHTSD